MLRRDGSGVAGARADDRTCGDLHARAPEWAYATRYRQSEKPFNCLGFIAHDDTILGGKKGATHDARVFQDQVCCLLVGHGFAVNLHLPEDRAPRVHQIAKMHIRPQRQVFQFLFLQGIFQYIAVIIFNAMMRKPRFRLFAGRSRRKTVEGKH